MYALVCFIYLCKRVSESHGKKEVGISAASVNPEVPQNWTQDGGDQEHHKHNEGVAEVWRNGIS